MITPRQEQPLRYLTASAVAFQFVVGDVAALVVPFDLLAGEQAGGDVLAK
jgi:hypothetical protein